MIIYTRPEVGLSRLFPHLTIFITITIFLLGVVATGHTQDQARCGFEKNYPEIRINGSLSMVTEDTESFQLTFESTTPSSLSSQIITLSSNGDLLDQRIEDTPVDTFINLGIVDDNSFVFGQGAEDTNPERVVFLNRVDFQGNEIFKQQYSLPAVNQIFSIGVSTVYATPDNYVILGRYVDVDENQTPTFLLYVIKTDKNGNQLSLNTYQVGDFISPFVYTVDSLDNIYAGYQTSGRTGHIIKLASDGTLVWDQSILGDLVSNRISKVELSNDEQQLIITGYADPKALIRRLDVVDGETISNILPSNLFTPDDFTVSEFGAQTLQTQDGGIIVSYPFFSTEGQGTGIEYGRLDSEGNPVWSNRLINKDYSNIRPIAETADGGLLFQTISRDTLFTILKTTDTGDLFPVCGQSSCQAEGGVDGIITFNSQSEVDAFGPCDIYDGSIAIAGEDITNVDALSGLREITGGFFIRRTALSLVSLEGLSSLTTVGRGIEIAGNLQGTENIPLKNLDGLRNLVSVGGGIITVIGTQLENVNGLSSIKKLDRRDEQFGATFQFVANTELTDIQLNELNTVDGGLTIAGNSKLTTISLPRLGTVSESLTIASNEVLDSVNLRAIFNIGSSTSSPSVVLSIEGNTNLADCCFISRTLDRLNEQQRTVSIRDNGATCAQAATIQQVCKDCPQIITSIELPDSVKTGDLVKIVATVQNAGLANAGPTNVGLYSFFGGSRQPGPRPVLIKEFPLEGLAIGEERKFTFEEILSFRRDPENISAGRYALLFRSDSVTTNFFSLRNCEAELNFNVKPQIGDLAISLEGSDCIDSTGELQTDIVVTNVGSDSITGPITLSFNSPPSPTAIIAEDEVVRTIFGTTFRTRQGDLAPGESISFSRPFSRPSLDSTDINYSLRLNLLDIQDTNPDNNSVRQRFFKREDCIPTTCDLLTNAAFNPCDPLVREIAVYEFEGASFLVTFPDNSMIADLPTRVVSCETGEQFCLLGFVANPTPCQEFFESAVKTLTVIDKEKDCQECSCPEIEAPVCGDDGITYANSCEAECAGTAWSEGPCEIEETFIDLEVDLTTANPFPAIYTKVPLTVTLTNKGNTTAENIQVNLTVCGDNSSGFQRSSGVVYATTKFTVSTGDYDYLPQFWTIPTLAANESATLTITLFTLTEAPVNIGAYVAVATPDDIDSTPDNIRNIGSCEINQDDEDDLVLNGLVLCDCPDDLDPVCGSDGITYDNPCEAECLGVTYEQGKCEVPSGETTCGEITVTYGAGKIDIVGQRGDDYFFKVHRRQPQWEYVAECNGKCGFGYTVSDLPAGSYYIDVYDKSWHLLCDDIEVKLDGGPSTADGERVLPAFGLSTELPKNGNQQLLVYPNPATNLVHINLMNSLSNNHTLIVTNNLGQVMKEISLKDRVTTTISLTNFINGVYQISVLADNKINFQQRLVVVK